MLTCACIPVQFDNFDRDFVLCRHASATISHWCLWWKRFENRWVVDRSMSALILMLWTQASLQAQVI